ncbi:Dps family protein [Crocinitomix algicola]|uniref:Dps family protein n=1 Tax=Crocinitomix algicola TaxID=1740263 RepID=UPI0008355960|nr:DNA starvation/stationary phase protection protein [Crocinitomix algicola]
METLLEQKTHRKLGFTNLESTEVVMNLNQLLANYQVYFHKLQNFHWNIKGRDFFELHEQFEKMYRDVFNKIDEIAERVRVFGKTPTSNMEAYLDQASIKESPTDLSGEFMVRTLVEDMDNLLTNMVETTDVASANGDVGTVDLMNSYIKELEKEHWMLISWLQDK